MLNSKVHSLMPALTGVTGVSLCRDEALIDGVLLYAAGAA
jgi:hypothetical protein